MSEMSFEQMLEESLKTIRNGEVVEGTVIDVKPDEIILNIGYKSDGIITRSEYTNEPNVDLTTVVNVGDTLEAKVVKVNDGEGQVLLSYKRLAAEKGSKRLEEAYENKEVLKATVSQVLAGGVTVVVDETRVFIPASLISDVYEKDLAKFKDQEIEFVITEFDPRKRRVIGNRKTLLVSQKAEAQKELFGKIAVGDVAVSQIQRHHIGAVTQIVTFLIVEPVAVFDRNEAGGVRTQAEGSHIHRPDKANIRVCFCQCVHILVRDAAVAHDHFFHQRQIGQSPLQS